MSANKTLTEPEKPLSAYALFFRDTVGAIKIQNPNSSFKDLSQIVSSMWLALDSTHKNVYVKKNQLACAEYAKALRAYRKNTEQLPITIDMDAEGVITIFNNTSSTHNNDKPATRTEVTETENFHSSQPIEIITIDDDDIVQVASSSSDKELKVKSKPSKIRKNNGSIGNSKQFQCILTGSNFIVHAKNIIKIQTIPGIPKIVKTSTSTNSGKCALNMKTPVPTVSPTTSVPAKELQPDMSGKAKKNCTKSMTSSVPAAKVVPVTEIEVITIEDDKLVQSRQKCTREACKKPAIINPDWEDEYCSNECVILHCRDVFNAWVRSNNEAKKS